MAVPVGLTISALSVAIVALVLYILQMVFGSPKMRLGFDIREVSGGRFMLCQIHNEPIAKGLPRMLRIKRTVAEDIMAYFRITELGSNKVITKVVPFIIMHKGENKAQRISLPASPFPAKFPILQVDYSTGKVEVVDEATKNVILPLGKYSAYIDVSVDGKSIETLKILVVSDKHPFAYWS